MRILIGGVSYELRMVRGDVLHPDGRACHGLTWPDRGLIEIDGRLPRAIRRKTTWHELGHAYKCELDIHDAERLDEEAFCNLVALSLSQLSPRMYLRIWAWTTTGQDLQARRVFAGDGRAGHGVAAVRRAAGDSAARLIVTNRRRSVGSHNAAAGTPWPVAGLDARSPAHQKPDAKNKGNRQHEDEASLLVRMNHSDPPPGAFLRASAFGTLGDSLPPCSRIVAARRIKHTQTSAEKPDTASPTQTITDFRLNIARSIFSIEFAVDPDAYLPSNRPARYSTTSEKDQ